MAVSQILSVTKLPGSVDNSANTSKVQILWQSTQTGDSWNGYTRVAKYYVSINGGAEKEYSVSYTLPKGTTNTIVDTIITVPHNADGTASVSVRTWMDTGISAGVVEKSQAITLPTIPRASTISYVSNVTLGNKCTVQWIPLANNLYYRIEFLVMGWHYITEVIHPYSTSLYTNSSYTIPIEVANHFTNSKYSDMTVKLYTYSDVAGTAKIGTESVATCKVYIPENENTLPSVAMSLSPINMSKAEFNGLYIQNKTLVRANFTGSVAKYSASISSYSMSVEGKTYKNEPFQSNLLSKYGSITVTGTALDSRGFSASITQNIDVIPYSKPSLVPFTGESSIICKRCDSTGNLTPSGTCLRIRAGRQYSKVIADGVQKNFCWMRFMYKVEGANSWIAGATILAKDSTADSLDAILTDVNLSPTTTYLVQIEVEDDIGEKYATLITIPTDSVTVHLREGGKAVGIGKYAEKDSVVDINKDWEVNVRGTLFAGNIRAGHIKPIDTYANKDFNDLKNNTGYYTDSSSPSYSGCKNYPVDSTGVLEVIALSVFAYQTYKTYDGEMYIRSCFNATWTEWKKVAFT